MLTWKGPWRVGRSSAAILAALVIAGCGSSAAPAAKTTKPAAAGASTAAQPHASTPLQHVSLQLPWLVAGYDAGFYMAQAKGYYKAAGLDVTIIPGRSSLLSAEIVANGKTTFGFADAGTAAQIISKGGDLKVLADLTQKSPVGIMHMPDVPVRTAHDLNGKTIFANSSGGPVIELLNAVLQRAGMTSKDVHLDVVAPSAEASSFETHPKDLALSFSYSAYPAVLTKQPKALFTYYADLGINTLSLGIITTNKEIRAHPGVVKSFVQASIKGWEYTIAHQSEAVKLMKQKFPKQNTFILTKSLANGISLTHTPATKGKPLGWMAQSDWKTTIDLLHKFSTLKNVQPLSTYYTNKYVPSAPAS